MVCSLVVYIFMLTILPIFYKVVDMQSIIKFYQDQRDLIEEKSEHIWREQMKDHLSNNPDDLDSLLDAFTELTKQKSHTNDM